MKRRFKKIVLAIVLILLVWSLINPYIFTFKQNDEDAYNAFSRQGMNISLGDFVDENNTLHYARIGDSTKPVLLFVHGSPGCWNTAWDYFMDSTWHSDYELVSIDRPGFGLSDYGKLKNLFEQSKIITQFVESEFKNREVQLIGHSYGGPLVLQLCADRDSLYKQCILLAGSVSPKAEHDEWQLNLFSSPFLNWMVPGSFRQGITELLWLKDDLKNYVNGLNNIETPIVAVHGTKDNMVPMKQNMQFLRSAFDSTQLTIHQLQGANHFLPWERYETVKQIIRSIDK